MIRRLPLAGMLTAVSLATAPLAGFLYRNRGLIRVADLWLYVVVCAGLLLAVVVSLSLVFGKQTGSRWSLLLGWCVFALFWYRDVELFADNFFLTKALPARGPIIWALATLSVLILIYRLRDRSWFLSAGMWFAVTVTLVPLGQYAVFTATTESQGVESFHSTTGTENVMESRPDIYFLLLDGFGRQDVLRELFGIDTSGFVEKLRQNGFVVANRALGAHPMTWLSIPAILDQDYQVLSGDRDWLSTTGQKDAVMEGSSRTHQILYANGYHFVTAGTAWPSLCDPSPISEVEDCVVRRPDIEAALSDAYIRYQITSMTPLLGLENYGLLPGVIAGFWQGPDLSETVGGKSFLTSDILEAVDKAHLRDDSTPLFVFGHMMYPHPPFTLGPECGVQARGLPDLSGGWDDVSGYQDGVDCAITQVLELVAEVDPSAVIVIQSDHGPTPGSPDSLSEADVPIESLWARASVLSAVRLPERCRPFVSDTYAGTNTFKVIIDCLAGNPNLPVPERSYWAWEDDDTVTDLTDRLRTYEESPA